MTRACLYRNALAGLLFLGVLALSWRPCSAETNSSSNVTNATVQVEILGNPGRGLYPSEAMWFARNIWDMQVLDGRIYFGMGNSNNTGPAPNAKGGHIWSYDPDRDKFRMEFQADEEQVDRFRIIDGRLVAPGHDSTDSWEFGNWYRLEDNGWKKHRNIPSGIHCYDMTSFQGKWFAALGTRPNSECILVSKDNGATWKGCGILGMRAYTLFTVGGRLYASLYRGVAAWDGRRFHENVPQEWFPLSPQGEPVRLVVRAVPFGEWTVYIGAHRTTDHQWSPFALYAARDPFHVKRIKLPGDQWDLLAMDSGLYVLSALKPEKGMTNWTVRVTRTMDLERWEDLFQFESAAFARSFEYLRGAFYFGLGCEADDLKPETGSILRIPWKQ